MNRMRVVALALLALASTASPSAQPKEKPATPSKPPAPVPGCLPSGNGYLRAQIRGALNLDIDWRNAELECEGGARPNGHGIRVSFAGPVHSDGRRLRMVFGVGATGEGVGGQALPTNLTVIFEGEKRLFATRGEDRCTTDHLNQERLGALGGTIRSYRVIARGFCIEPASGVAGDERIVVTSFDFAGRVTFVDSAPDVRPRAGLPALPRVVLPPATLPQATLPQGTLPQGALIQAALPREALPEAASP
jgi:hypothetical protein